MPLRKQASHEAKGRWGSSILGSQSRQLKGGGAVVYWVVSQGRAVEVWCLQLYLPGKDTGPKRLIIIDECGAGNVGVVSGPWWATFGPHTMGSQSRQGSRGLVLAVVLARKGHRPKTFDHHR